MSSSEIIAGARASKLSQAQFAEITHELKEKNPGICLIPKWVETTGDKDLKTSLRTLEKTDFFTKEIDAMLLKGECRIAIHSAKDLPDPLPKGLVIAAITQGVDSSDALVFREKEILCQGALIGTSCERRENSIRAFRADLKCADIRGTIESRLAQLSEKKFDGVVIAEAAIIRLKLQHLSRIILKGETAPLQGKLAVVVREDDLEMRTLFEAIDSRKKNVLYLGLDPSHFETLGQIVHYPVIKIKPRKVSFKNLNLYSHIIFTSKTAVKLFFQNVAKENIKGKVLIAVGEITAWYLKEQGFQPQLIAEEETQEGIISLLEKINLEKVFILLPRSSIARPILDDYLKRKMCNLKSSIYTTLFVKNCIPFQI